MDWIEKFRGFFIQPYPFYYRGKNFLYFVFVLFLMAFGFNYLFRPFDVHVPEHKMDYFWISLIHSLTPILIAVLLHPLVRNPRLDEKWTVSKEILLIGVYLFLIGVIQFLIRDFIYDNPNNWSWRYLFEEIRNTFLVGTLLLSILISINFNRLNSQYTKKAAGLNSWKSKNSSFPNSTTFSIKTQVKGDDFNLDVSQFLFAKAEGNYVEIIVKNDDATNKLLKRISIKDLETQLSSATQILRIHRSYLLNLHFIKNITGNAQGYRIELHDTNEVALVSRNMIQPFEKRLESFSHWL